MCATHNQLFLFTFNHSPWVAHDLCTQILHVSQSTWVMLQVLVVSSNIITFWTWNFWVLIIWLFLWNLLANTFFFSVTKNMNGKVDCFLSCCIFSTTVSTFSLWSPFSDCEEAAHLINDNILFTTAARFDFSTTIFFFLLSQQGKHTGKILFYTLQAFTSVILYQYNFAL